MLKILCLHISLLAFLMIGEKLFAQGFGDTNHRAPKFGSQIPLDLPKGMEERLSKNACLSKKPIARKLLGCEAESKIKVDLDPNEDLFVSLGHPANWNGQTGKQITQNMIAYLHSICPARPLGNPKPIFTTSCNLMNWMGEFLALDELFKDENQFHLVFEKGVNLKDVTTVNFTYTLDAEPLSSSFEALARFIILKKIIIKNLPQLAATIHAISTTDGRNTWVFDSAIFPRLTAYFSGDTVISRLSGFARGLVCSDRSYVVPRCLEIKAKMETALKLLKMVAQRNHWDSDLKDASNQLNDAEARDKVRFAWSHVRTELLSTIQKMPLDLSEAKNLGDKLISIFFNHPADIGKIDDIAFAQASFDFLEISEALNGISAPTKGNLPTVSKELQSLIDESFIEIKNTTDILRSAIDYATEIKNGVQK